MLRHVLPNALTSTLTYLPFTGAIGTLSALDFLGFEVRRWAARRWAS